MDNVITVIIIDDHPLVLNGFEFILNRNANILLRKTFTCAADALNFLMTRPHRCRADGYQYARYEWNRRD
ncbi:Uncharacterised protein [Sphingobacterium daejeonense]|nr:hypothetical protein [Sphingobacterium daejeonense]VTQ08241.1 Uncharacterised protein [Sphingobacterium daejeonense]